MERQCHRALQHCDEDQGAFATSAKIYNSLFVKNHENHDFINGHF